MIGKSNLIHIVGQEDVETVVIIKEGQIELLTIKPTIK
jgi:hypothetical protein